MTKKNHLQWKGKNVLITGAGGFIGSHLVEALIRRNANVHGLVRYNSRGDLGWLSRIPRILKSMRVLSGDLRDADNVFRVVKGMDYVFHLGAIISIPYSYLNPQEVTAVNVMGTLNVLNACRNFKIKRIVHTSTSEVYGTARYVPIDENHPLQGQSPYSASKIGADKLAESFYDAFDTPVVTVRPFNTYGPRQSARAVIPTIAIQLLAKSGISIGSLEPVRDFTYVTDTVEGMILAAEAPKAEGRVINLGSNSEISIAELIKMIAETIGCEYNISTQRSRIRPIKSEVKRLRADNSLAKELLGWSPKVDLKQGIKKTLDWLRGNIEYYERAKTDYIF